MNEVFVLNFIELIYINYINYIIDPIACIFRELGKIRIQFVLKYSQS